MTERVRLLLVAANGAPIRALAPRLQDPELQLIICGSAREALARLGTSLPDAVILDGTLPGPDVMRLYGQLRRTIAGANVPILFTSHDESSVDLARTTAPDFYVGPEAPLDEIEQLLFTFLPESLFEIEPGPAARPEAIPDTPLPPEPRQVPGPRAGISPVERLLAEREHEPAIERTSSGAPDAKSQAAPIAPPSPSGPPTWAEIGSLLETGPAKAALAYLGVYVLAEALAAAFETRLGLLIHGGLLLAIFFHGANVPSGPERTFYWTLWLAPLTRIYGLAQPYAGASALTWWALTAVPMAVAGVVALRLAGLTAREAGLVPSPREAPVAVFMVPVGLALGLGMYLLLEPRPVGEALPFGGAALVALVAIVNPGIVDEIVFRGVLRRGTAGLFGPGLGVLYVSLLYAPVLPAGLVDRGGLTAVALTFVVGLLLGVLTLRTGSVIGAAVAHASLAVGLVVLGPYLVPDGLGLSSASPAGPATPEVRPPTPKPAVIVVSPPAQPSPASQPAPAGPAGQTAPAGQPPPAGPAATPGPTHISLAPPLPPPQAGAPPAAPGPAAQPGAPVQAQAAVVRGTGGSGARLRAQPGNTGQIITVLPENTPLLVIGQDRTADGLVWRNVRTPNGSEGWIAASFVTTGQ
jgi:membrane protease YdiL (CAAX protease family)/CheY-like chemotaxis protein